MAGRIAVPAPRTDAGAAQHAFDRPNWRQRCSREAVSSSSWRSTTSRAASWRTAAGCCPCATIAASRVTSLSPAGAAAGRFDGLAADARATVTEGAGWFFCGGVLAACGSTAAAGASLMMVAAAAGPCAGGSPACGTATAAGAMALVAGGCSLLPSQASHASTSSIMPSSAPTVPSQPPCQCAARPAGASGIVPCSSCDRMRLASWLAALASRSGPVLRPPLLVVVAKISPPNLVELDLA